MLAAGTIESLLKVKSGQYAKNEGNFVPEIEFGNTLGYPLTYIIEMRSFSLNNTSKADYCISSPLFRKPYCSQRELKTAGNVNYLNIRFGSSSTNQRVHCTFKKFLCYLLIPFSDHNTKPIPLCYR